MSEELNCPTIIWIGRYEADIYYSYEQFFCTYTYYGSGNGVNVCYYPKHTDKSGDSEDIDGFLRFVIIEIQTQDYTSKPILICYNPLWLNYILKNLKEDLVMPIFENKYSTLRLLGNKTMTRIWMKDVADIPDFSVMSARDISYESVRNSFPLYERFVVQKNVSEGGYGTYILDSTSQETVKTHLDCEIIYYVSPFIRDAIPINVTIYIHDDGWFLFPISEQLLSLDSSNRLIYSGSDFCASERLTKETRDEVDAVCEVIAERIHDIGYRGICGVDLLISGEKIYFIEINARFQASTMLLDRYMNVSSGKSLYKALVSNDCEKALRSTFNENCTIKMSFSYRNTDPELVSETLNLYSSESRHIYDEFISKTDYEYESSSYYNQLAPIYGVILPGWEDYMKDEAKTLDKLFKQYARIDVKRVLDCTCGIGVQSIALSLLGYDVHASDNNRAMIEQAEKNSKKYEVSIRPSVVDCTRMDNYYHTSFDAIISIDNALPHLKTMKNLEKCFRAVHKLLNSGGVFLASFRDYAELLKTKPISAYPPRRNTVGNSTYTILKTWSWDNNICTSDQYVIEETPSNRHLYHESYDQLAVTGKELCQLCESIGFAEVYWIVPSEIDYYQPVLCLVK